MQVHDNSTIKYGCKRVGLVSGFDLNVQSTIRFDITDENQYSVPSDNYLYIRDRVRKEDHSAYANADAVALINNAIPYLLKNVKYELFGVDVKKCNNFGQAPQCLVHSSIPG
jgi:hypothetical protein